MSTGNGPTAPAHVPSWVTTAVTVRPTALTAALGRLRGRRPGPQPRVSPLNYLRVPTLAAGLSLLIFLPGIIQQGRVSYLTATGQTQQPFFGRWLLLVAVLYGVSALAYAAQLAIAGRRAPDHQASRIRP